MRYHTSAAKQQALVLELVDNIAGMAMLEPSVGSVAAGGEASYEGGDWMLRR